MTDEMNKVFQMRVSESFLRELDEWRRIQPDLPPRAEAIRRLVAKGIMDSAKAKVRRKPAS